VSPALVLPDEGDRVQLASVAALRAATHNELASTSDPALPPSVKPPARRPGPMIFGARGETLRKGPFVIIIIIIRCTYIYKNATNKDAARKKYLYKAICI
jgi:hypothetical protein